MGGRQAVEAVRRGQRWGDPILMPSAAGLGARIGAQVEGAVWADPQKLADACVAAARYLGADAVWVPSFGTAGVPDLEPAIHRDAVQRALAAAGRLQLACVAEIRGPLARAAALGGDLDEALKRVRPDVVAEFEALANLRPDIIVLAEPEPSGEQAENRTLARLYGALRRLAEHYDVLKGMKPAMPGMTGDNAPDLSFGAAAGLSAGRSALVLAVDWTDAGGFAAACAEARGAARQAEQPLIVSCAVALGGEIEPSRCREAAAHIMERV
ncbi:hypothetical protein HHL25_22285 [Rhizobium sp. S-51]|uniref:Uncharacterized protein n=1 Tax=Rhizobium terricola TaxID=2728849 RepID=A0A7Y0FYQ5_9HYPH|nr:hypothetical protein [Rhizobium terricola]NML76874.1 hypothetical protein [Rhizobium terricola]